MGSHARRTRIDAVLRALANTHRRRILYYLREHDEASERELVDVLTGWLATDRPTGRTGPEDRERIAIALEHVHLPMLGNAGLLRTDGHVVTVENLPAWTDACLEAISEAEWDVPVDELDDELW